MTKPSRKRIRVHKDKQEELENELRAAKRLAEESNAAKSRFIANISHEIRTQLSGAMGMIELLQNNTLHSADRCRFLDMTMENCKNLLTLTNEILDLSKIESNKIYITKEPFDFSSKIRSTLYPHSIQAEKKGLRFFCKIDSKIPSCVIGDAFRISQIINNLINNAIKFTDEGRIIISVELQKKTTASPADPHNGY